MWKRQSIDTYSILVVSFCVEISWDSASLDHFFFFISQILFCAISLCVGYHCFSSPYNDKRELFIFVSFCVGKISQIAPWLIFDESRLKLLGSFGWKTRFFLDREQKHTPQREIFMLLTSFHGKWKKKISFSHVNCCIASLLVALFCVISGFPVKYHGLTESRRTELFHRKIQSLLAAFLRLTRGRFSILCPIVTPENLSHESRDHIEWSLSIQHAFKQNLFLAINNWAQYEYFSFLAFASLRDSNWLC